jgi:hypothetical protein
MDGKKEDTRPKMFVCIDVEARGISPIRHGINAIGATFHVIENGVPTLVDKKLWALAPLPGQDYEHACLQEFWLASDKMRALKAYFESQANPAHEVIFDFYETLAACTERYNVRIINDAPEFDMPFISYYLDYHGYPPLVNLPHKDYVPRTPAQVSFGADPEIVHEQTKTPLLYSSIINVVTYGNGIMGNCARCVGYDNKKNLVAKLAKLDAVATASLGDTLYDHNPANDATYVANLFFLLCSKMCNKECRTA